MCGEWMRNDEQQGMVEVAGGADENIKWGVNFLLGMTLGKRSSGSLRPPLRSR